MSERPWSKLVPPESAAGLSMESASASPPPAQLLERWRTVAVALEPRFVKAWSAHGACTGWFAATSAVARCVPRRVVLDRSAGRARRRRRRDGS